MPLPTSALGLLMERGRLCEWCRAEPWTDKHHCFIRRDKRYPELDVPINFMCVCHRCHMKGEVDTQQARLIFYFSQLSRGYPVDNWLASLPLRVKPTYERYRCNFIAPSRLQNEPLQFLATELTCA